MDRRVHDEGGGPVFHVLHDFRDGFAHHDAGTVGGFRGHGVIRPGASSPGAFGDGFFLRRAGELVSAVLVFLQEKVYGLSFRFSRAEE